MALLRGRQIGCLVGLTALAAAVVWLGYAVRDAQRAAIASCEQGPLNQIMLALHSYHDEYGSFPPAYIADSEGRPMHSWRALILPYCDSQGLSREYDFSEPWNGPHNIKLANRAPGVFGCRRTDMPEGITNIVAVTGTGTAFPGTGCISLKDITDGPENTILIVEIADSKVPWLAPIDLPAEEAVENWNNPERTGISSIRWRRPYVAFADRLKAFSLGKELPSSSLRALLTISGNEPVNKEILLERGQIRGGAWIE